MAGRQRYWKIEPGEVGSFSYNESKLLNWDIKCSKKSDASAFVGVFAYRNGTPVGYESVKGISYYHNHIDDGELKLVSAMLKKDHGGDVTEHSNRTIIKGSSVPYSGPELGALARKLESLLDAKAVITLEFEGLTQDEQDSAGLPPTKLLPVPGPKSRNGV